MTDCQNCGTTISEADRYCRACGAPLRDYRRPPREYGAPSPGYAPCYYYCYTRAPYRPLRTMAVVLALLLGSVGIHKFYCKRIAQGIAYLLLCWTLIPALVGLIEGVIYLCYTDEQFDSIYGIS